MALSINGLLFDELTSDPGSPVEGQMWFNTTSHLFKIYRNGATTSFVDAVELANHTGSTSNPHSTTLEQARTAGATLAGSINMGGYAITNLASPTNDGDASTKGWTNDQIKARIRALDWQDSVLDKDLTAPPGGESVGDRYIVASPATGAWLTKEKNIAECTSTGPTVWTFIVPNEGFCTRVEDENTLYIYDGSAWGTMGGAIDHGSLLGLGDDDHTQYLLANGTRALGGNWSLGGYNLTNAGTINSVDIADHSARHDPGGLDALTTAAATGLTANSTNTEGNATSFARSNHTHAIDVTNGTISTIDAGDTASEGSGTGLSRRDHQHAVSTGAASSITDSTNAEGSATSLARSDHSHAHGTRGGGTLHSTVSNTAAGFQPQSHRSAAANPTVNDDGTAGWLVGSYWINTTADSVWQCADNSTGAAVWKELTNTVSIPPFKAGKVLAASFAGNPKKATVTFSTAFADADYGANVTCVTTNARSFAPTIESQLAGSFVINLGSNNVTDLTQVNWTAIKTGESA